MSIYRVSRSYRPIPTSFQQEIIHCLGEYVCTSVSRRYLYLLISLIIWNIFDGLQQKVVVILYYNPLQILYKPQINFLFRIRLSEKFLSFYQEIIGARFLFYIILSNYLRFILFCWDKRRDISQTWFHVCAKVHCCKKHACKRKTLSGQPNRFGVERDEMGKLREAPMAPKIHITVGPRLLSANIALRKRYGA